MTVNIELLEIYLKRTNFPSFASYLKSYWGANHTKVSPMTLKKIHAQCEKVNRCRPNQRSDSNEGHGNSTPAWKKGQLKLFTWFVALYCYLQAKKIFHLNAQDFKAIANIFHNHSQDRIKYEIHCLTPSQSLQSRKWIPEEMQLLNNLVTDVSKQEKTVKWKYISFRLYEESSGEYIRTFKECRQRWMNHCNPELNKQQWTKEEDYALFQEVLLNGKQWSRIAKEFKTQRTEHMIKNRYCSLIREGKKKNCFTSLPKLELMIFKRLRSKVEKVKLSNIEPEQINPPISEISSLNCSSLDIPQQMNENSCQNLSLKEERALHQSDICRIVAQAKFQGERLGFGKIDAKNDYFRYTSPIEEERFMFCQAEELRQFRSQLLDKLSLGCVQLLTPELQFGREQALFCNQDSYN